MELQPLFMAIYLVAIYASVTGVVAGAVFCVLRLVKKKRSFFSVLYLVCDRPIPDEHAVYVCRHVPVR